MSLSGSQKFAMLLCKFADSTTVEPHPTSYYQDLIERAGTGGLADYWKAASLNHIDLGGSMVYGWKVLTSTHDQYVAAHPSRWEKILGAIAAFPEVNVSGYTGVVAVFNRDIGDSGAAGAGVLCGPEDTNVTFLAHETGHVFGLQHSFDTSSRMDVSWSAPGEYYDLHDIMSAMNVYMDRTSAFGMAGPLLAAPNLDRLGWLDPSRVWTPPLTGSSSQSQLDLVSLDSPGFPGYIAAKIGTLYVEFRTVDGWDKAIPRPAVLIHFLRDPNAVVLASDPVKYVNDWQPGQTYGPSPIRAAIFHGGTWVHVESFNMQARTARITITHQTRPISMLDRIFEGAAQIVLSQAQDGGGWIVLASGRIIPVAPRSPVLEVLDKLAIAAETEALSVEARRSVERTVFADLANLLERFIEPHSSGKGGG